ncbi:retrovirus-related Pol polyprotein from transposon 412 [Trichonephila clavipes]|nr:retrovirus-related Pol polyprotein from transposon 412 [Trichonephila clavipes]
MDNLSPVLRVEQSTLTLHPVRNVRLKGHTGKYVDGHVETNEQNLSNSIFKALTNLDEFQLTLNNSEASFSEGENVISKTTFQKRITLDRNFSSEGTDQHSPFQQHPVSNSPLPSVQGYSFMPAHQNVSSLCTQNAFPPYSNKSSLTEMNTQFWTLLRDISATSRKFTGEDFYSVNSFFRDIEENFDLFPAISSSQKLIFAKRLVCGTAKSFLFSQRNLNTYESFKKALIEEFSDSVTSIEIHRELEKRKMYKTETLMQYFNSMRELANRCDSKIDEASIIQYVLNGIDGPRSYKIILYGAISFSEFKQKLRTYETVIKNMGIHNSNSPNFRHSYESRGRDFKQQRFQRKPTKFNASDAARNPQRCFNCNDIGHLSKSCPNHSRGPRCLSCNLYGHKSFECRRANLNNTSTPPSGVNAVHELPSPINMCKDVTIFGRKLNELVDTGSNLTLLRNSTYINIDAPPLKQTNTLLTGFGFSRINVIGTFDSEITIDDQIFPVTVSVVPNSCTNYDLIIGCPNVSQHNRAEVEQLLSTYTPKKTKTVNIELDIALTDDERIFHKPRRLPFAERDIVDAQVDEWVKNGIVEPSSSSYASQVVVVKKKDGKSRVCIDYRRLNRKLIKDNHPLPLIDDILDCLQNVKIFTTLDLKNGFSHVAVNERSSKFTSFVTHNGQYQFRRMPFGLSTCPSTFMRYINAIFRHLISKSIVLPYMDDVVIPAANESQALEYLKIVLEVACDYGLEINFKNVNFYIIQLSFLAIL